MILLRHLLLLRMILRWLHDNLSGPRVEELLQLTIALLNSSLENGAQEDDDLSMISSRMLISTLQWKAVLNVKWSACQRSSMVRYGWSLYFMALMAGNFYLLTQFMSFQGLCFLFKISWILRSKKDHLVVLTIFLKIFQSSRLLDVL